MAVPDLLVLVLVAVLVLVLVLVLLLLLVLLLCSFSYLSWRSCKILNSRTTAVLSGRRERWAYHSKALTSSAPWAPLLGDVSPFSFFWVKPTHPAVRTTTTTPNSLPLGSLPQPFGTGQAFVRWPFPNRVLGPHLAAHTD